MTTPLAVYRRRVEAGALAADAAQEQAVRALDRLYRDLVAAPAAVSLKRRAARWAGRPIAPPRGLYLYGSVGRGKTAMMDMFFGALPFADKTRQHFHRFMASVHERLKGLRDRENPLDVIAAQLAAETRVICFDELAVNDIADAMILGNLFAGLFERGVALAATSNIAPANLYREGLQRQRFLPTIALLERHTEVLHVAGATDYRLRVLERADVYLPTGPDADGRLSEYFDALAPEPGDRGGRIELFGRPIPYRRAADGVIWFDFDALCDGPRSADDYIELAKIYQTVLLSNVPQLGVTLENQARRLVNLVDEFYDRRVKLILSAAVPLMELYRGARLEHDFARTQSRLIEMQSRDYLASEHKP